MHKGLRRFFLEEHLVEALQAACCRDQLEFPVSTTTLYTLLQDCIKKKDLHTGRKVHMLIKRSGLESNTCLGGHLIHMFGLCGSLSEANDVFCKLSKQSTFTWSTIILANAKLGQEEHAIKLYHQMRQSNLKPTGYIFVAVLKACSNKAYLEEGQLIHADIIELGYELNVYVGNTLIDMYAKCASLEQARMVFNKLAQRDVVTWSAMISGYALHGSGHEALQVFQQMQEQNMDSDEATFVCILKACSGVRVLHFGNLVHAIIIVKSFESNMAVGSSLIDMYVKCGSIEDAQQVFDQLPKKNVVTWTMMIAGYAQDGSGLKAFQLFHQMQERGLEPNNVTFVSFLIACSNTAALEHGEFIHAHIVETGYESDVFVGSTLIDMYAKCGGIKDARCVFNTLPKQTVVTWNVMIAGYAHEGQGHEALLLFQEMQQEGLQPHNGMYVSLLKACSCIAALNNGKFIHALAIDSGHESQLFVGNTLIDMYVHCKSLKDAYNVFNRLQKRDILTWSVIISGYAQDGHCKELLLLLHEMQQEGLEPDSVIFVSILQACSCVNSLDQGKYIHSFVIESGCELDVYVGSTVLDMYAKNGKLEDARRLFDKLPKRSMVTWSAMIAGYVLHDYGKEALSLFQEMQHEAQKLDAIILISIVKACFSIGALNQGKWIHVYILEGGFESDSHVGSILVDMYAGFGLLKDASAVFDTQPVRSIETWNAMICGCAQHSDYKLALQYFERLKQEGIKPSEATFVCLLSAFNHEGLLHECYHLFKDMQEYLGISQTLDHYNCVIDLLGRAGLLNEAEDMLKTLPFQDNIVGYTSLLSHCRTHGRVEVGRWCFDHTLMVDDRHAAGYMLMSCIYTNAGMLEAAKKVKELKLCAHAWKKPGTAFIEINDKVHDFVVGDSSHPVMDDIYAMLWKLIVEIKSHGYVPQSEIKMLFLN